MIVEVLERERVSNPNLLLMAGELPGEWTATSVCLPDDLPESDLDALLVRLLTLGRGHQWWIGDTLNFRQRKYGMKYSVAMMLTGYGKGYLANMASVAARFETSRRREVLPWSYHADVTSLTDEEQERWLERAEEENWSRKELRKQLKAAISGFDPDKQPLEFASENEPEAASEEDAQEALSRDEEAQAALDAIVAQNRAAAQAAQADAIEENRANNGEWQTVDGLTVHDIEDSFGLARALIQRFDMALADVFLDFPGLLEKLIGEEAVQKAASTLRLSEASVLDFWLPIVRDMAQALSYQWLPCAERVGVGGSDLVLLKALAARPRHGQTEPPTPSEYLSDLIQQRAAQAGLPAEAGV